MSKYSKFQSILDQNLPVLLQEKFGEHVFEDIPDKTPLTKLLRGIHESCMLFQQSKRGALIGIKKVFDSLSVDIDQFNAENSKSADFNNVNPYLGYAVPLTENISAEAPIEEKEQFLRNYIRQRYDFFEDSTISDLEIQVFLFFLRTPFVKSSRKILPNFAKCPYYEPALYLYFQEESKICSKYMTAWSQAASIITSGIVARISQIDCSKQEAEELRIKLSNYAKTEKYTGNILRRLPKIAEILRQYPVVLTGSNMASDLTGMIPRYAPWKFSCRDEFCSRITIKVYTPSKVINFTSYDVRPKDISLSSNVRRWKAKLLANATGEIRAPEVLLEYRNGEQKSVEMEEGCDADLIVLPNYDLTETAEAIFKNEKERNPNLKIVMEPQDRATGTVFNIRAQYPQDSAMDSVLAFVNYMPKQIYQVDPSFVFQHHISQVRAYLSWNEIGGGYQLTYDPSYCSGDYCSNFFCIASKKEGALAILNKYQQRGVNFVDLCHLVDTNEYYYCWVRG
jgi:hypothetical protein